MKILTKEIIKKKYSLDSGLADLRLIKEPFKLADNLSLDSGLNLSGNVFIKELPKKLVVKGDLNISNTEIKMLGNEIVVDGDFGLANSKVEKLPSGLSVGKNLVIRNTKISSLPTKLKIGGNLLISLGQLKTLPDDLRLDGIVKSVIDQSTSLFKYARTLFARDLKAIQKDFEGIKLKAIKEKFIFCDSLEIDDDLDLIGSKVLFLNDTMKVNGKIFIDTKQVALFDGIEKIAKEILVFERGDFQSLQTYKNPNNTSSDIQSKLENLEKLMLKILEILEKK